jgi:TRAP-type C4-dicarboxylate transport system permease small subunit
MRMTDEQIRSEPASTTTDQPSPHDETSSLPGFLGVIDVAIAKIEAVMLALGVLLMALNTIANVVGRYVFQTSIYFTEELNSVLIILITFAGISYAARHGRHIRMSAIFDTLSPRLKKGLMVIIALVTALFMLALAWYSFTYILTQAGRGRVLPALQIPVWWNIVWVPIGFLMTGLQYLLTAVKNVIDEEVYLSTSVQDGYEEE